MNRRRLRSAFLWTGAVLGSLCLLVAAIAAIFDVTPLVFRSGSMAPDYPTGSLALARTTPAAELRVGDVVSLVGDNGTRVTHRITALEHSGDSAVLQTKGDANEVVDPGSATVSEADRVVASVPGLGYLVAWISGPVAVFLGGLLTGVLLMIAFRPGGARRDPEGQDDSDDTPTRSALAPVTAAGAGLLAVVLGAALVPGTLAAFTDSATATSGSLSSTGLNKPSQPSATYDSRTRQVTVSWAEAKLADNTAVSGYQVLRYDSSNDTTPTVVCTTTTARSCAISASSGTVWYAVQSKAGSQWLSTPSDKKQLKAT